MLVILKAETNYYAIRQEGSSEAAMLLELGYRQVARSETKDAAIAIIKKLAYPPHARPVVANA